MDMNSQGLLPDSSTGRTSRSGDAFFDGTRAGERWYVLQVPAELASLTLVEKMTEFLCKELLAGNIKTDSIVLSVSEAMSNALRHGRLTDDADSINVQYYHHDAVLKVCVTDSGCELPANVIARYREHVVEMPATAGKAEALPEGGWGINLILQGSSEISYQRVAGLNHLTLCFELSV